MVGRVRSAVTLLPLGIFWLSLISYQVFPRLGIGQTPNSITMFSFLSLWGLFMALLFLGSFRQSLAVQVLYGAMMFSFLALAMDNLRDDRVFLFVGCLTGMVASGVAVYMFFAQLLQRYTGRNILPLGEER
jgi:succinate-acetate transporter protein